jgi:ketosteroid isomerase-like protein
VTEDEDIAMIRAAFTAWERLDMDGFFDLLHPEIEWHPPLYAPRPGPHHGHEEVRKGLAAYFGSFERFTPELEGIKPAGSPNTYLAQVATDTKTRESGIEARIHVFHLIRVRDEKLASLRVFTDRAEAMAAANLPADED